jgi:hypothetical protein
MHLQLPRHWQLSSYCYQFTPLYVRGIEAITPRPATHSRLIRMRACLQLPMQSPATASRTAAAARTVLTPPSINNSTIVIGGALLSSGPKLDFGRQALAVCHVGSRL